jgi:hypothetical protein
VLDDDLARLQVGPGRSATATSTNGVYTHVLADETEVDYAVLLHGEPHA